MGERPTLTTTSGMPVAENQNSITAGPRGPVLMQDFHLLEKPIKAAALAGDPLSFEVQRNEVYPADGEEARRIANERMSLQSSLETLIAEMTPTALEIRTIPTADGQVLDGYTELQHGMARWNKLAPGAKLCYRDGRVEEIVSLRPRAENDTLADADSIIT